MNAEIWETAAAIVVSLGGGGLLVAALSNWLGRVWAHRLMTTETAKHDRELAELRSALDTTNQARLAEMQRDLDVYKSKHIGAHQDKLTIYRMVIDTLAELLASLDKHYSGKLTAQEGQAVLDRFNRDRLKLYGYLAMLAPQAVMDAHDKVFDYLLAVIEGSDTYDWSRVRKLAIDMVNEIRTDLAIDSSPIAYRGVR